MSFWVGVASVLDIGVGDLPEVDNNIISCQVVKFVFAPMYRFDPKTVDTVIQGSGLESDTDLEKLRQKLLISHD